MKIKFRTASKTPRPIRLSEEIRAWANDSLNGKYGDEVMKTPGVSLDDIESFEKLDNFDRYDLSVRRIAEQAPIRICEQELISGSATLGMAISHVVPATYNGSFWTWSISHLTIDYEKVLKMGINGYEREIDERLMDEKLSDYQRRFLKSLKSTIESMRIWHHRYLEATKDKKPEIYELLLRVPFEPARTFHEAVQAIWFEFSFVRLCGNWPGIGRIDYLLGDYLKNDLACGQITLQRAREILASFFIKGCEWIRNESLGNLGSGDAQHYQNIVLAGVDSEGMEITNEVTYLVLDIVEELPISDFPITIRVNRKSSERLLRRAAMVIRHGGGIIAMYNEELVIKAMSGDGYPIEEARMFANDGCWEVQVPGSTDFTYMPFDGMQILNQVLGICDGQQISDFQSFEELFKAYSDSLKSSLEGLYNAVTGGYELRDGKWVCRNLGVPPSVVSLFENGCIENAMPYNELGPKYTVRSPHMGGAPDVANSLCAIDCLVFREKKMAFVDLMKLLKNNWSGNEALRQYVRNKITYYGNDDDRADSYMTRVVDTFGDITRAIGRAHADGPIRFIPGISTFGRQIEWLDKRMATAFGYLKGEILSGNDSPTPGTDFSGATAIIKSYCKSNLESISCGAALDIKIFPETLSGENGLQSLKALMRAVVSLGGFFVQIDVIDANTLKEAQKHPDDYRSLSVRVSGWNARFVTLCDDWQRMIIERTTQNI